VPLERESNGRSGQPDPHACRLETVSASETRLIVPGEQLSLKDRTEFTALCEKLLRSGTKTIVVDLTSLQNIYSLFIGVLVDIALRARDAGKTFIIRAGGRVAESLRLMNVDATAELDVV
jgi:anti-anti-sigma regulatory factor